MVLSNLSIRRPVLATVMSLIIVLLGVMSYLRLPVREYPDIDEPIVSVHTSYRGASAQVMESQVTKPLEDSLAGIAGIKTMKSRSREEISNINIEFRRDVDPDDAAAEVRDRVSRVRSQLPDDVDEPVISKVESDAHPIIWLSLRSDNYSALEMTDFADRIIKDRLQTIPGVATVVIGGARTYAMRIWLDRDRLAGYGLTVQNVEDALRHRNVDIPSGRIEGSEKEFTVFSETDLRTPEQFRKMVIRQVSGYPVRLGDVARVQLGAEDYRKLIRVNGQPALGLGVVRQSTANTLEVGRAVKAEIPKLQAMLPAGMKLGIGFDSSIFIEQSIQAVFKTLVEALLLVTAVTFIFLRSPRSTLIPFVAIPVSLVGSFVFVYALGFSVNVLTLLGLVLAIGLVVDDAIVMLENIHRRIESGMHPRLAAMEGSGEIAFAIIAMTLTLATVFVPLAFMTGNTGRLFREFALAVSCAVLVSGFVALTLSPMMCSRFLKVERRHGAVYRATERVLRGIIGGYRGVLHTVLDLRWIVLPVLLVVLAATVGLYRGLHSELSPTEDRGSVIISATAPEGATLGYTDRYERAIESFVKKIPEVRRYFAVIAPGLRPPNPVNLAITFVSLKPWDQRQRSQQDIAAELAPQLSSLPGVLAYALNPPSLGQGFRSQPVDFVLQGPSYAALGDMVGKMMVRIRDNPGFANPDSDLKLNKPQLSVSIDRDKAAAVGVDVDEIGRILESLFGGTKVTRFKRAGEQYYVMVELPSEARTLPRDISRLYARGSGGALVPLDNLVTVRETVAPKELNHFNRLRAATITANLSPGYALGDALDFLDRVAREVLPASASTALDGESLEFRESGQVLFLTFGLALVFIYLVLAAQFESFVDPLIILLTVPMAIGGALFTLNVTGGSLNVYSQIGLVMLVGLITKHGILIVEFANQLQERGRSIREAVEEAAALRLRPILMTSFAMILGAVPLALATGAGAESREQIGWVIVGGLTFGSLFTIFVVPAAYTFLAHRRESPEAVEARLRREEAGSREESVGVAGSA